MWFETGCIVIRGDPGYQKEACSYKRPEEDSRPRSIRRGSGNLKDHTVDVIERGLLLRARTDKQRISPRALEVRPTRPRGPLGRPGEASAKAGRRLRKAGGGGRMGDGPGRTCVTRPGPRTAHISPRENSLVARERRGSKLRGPARDLVG